MISGKQPRCERRSALLLALIAWIFLLSAGCAHLHSLPEPPISRILFGSCINTNSHPMLDRILQLDFDFSIMLGDNIYADTTNMAVMKAKYDALEFSPFWKTLRQKAPTLATWDDHDMGGNDAGGNYPMKDESQKLFLEFMDEPPQSPRWKRPGVYDAYTFGPRGKRVQVIMLDTRYFRSKPATGENGVVPSGGKYIPHPDTNTTILGEAQWRWFEEQLRQPAEVRIIATSIQFISEFSGAEAWANFPHEKQRMLALLEKHKTEGVFFISGDRHWAELSRLDRPGRYSLYDLTSSSITQVHPRGTPTPNRYRALPQTYHQPNVGIIEIKWLRSGPMINLQLLDLTGAVQLEKAFLPFPKFSHGQ